MSKKSRRRVEEVDQFDYDEQFESHDEPVPTKQAKYKIKTMYLIDQDEVNALINASNAPYVEPPVKPFDLDYPTYTQDEVLALLKGDYNNKKSKKKK